MPENNDGVQELESMDAEWFPWQLAHDADTYGDKAGKFILTSDDGETEHPDGDVFDTFEDAQRRALWLANDLRLEGEQHNHVEAARRAIVAFLGDGSDGIESEDAQDLITDLLLYAQADGWDALEMLEQARRHFIVETGSEELAE